MTTESKSVVILNSPAYEFEYDSLLCYPTDSFAFPTTYELDSGQLFSQFGAGPLIEVTDTTGKIDLHQYGSGTMNLYYFKKDHQCTDTIDLSMPITIGDSAPIQFSYPKYVLCSNDSTLITPVFSGSGVFSTSGGGINLDPITGVIQPIANSPSDTFYVAYEIQGPTCFSPDSVEIEIIKRETEFSYLREKYCKDTTLARPVLAPQSTNAGSFNVDPPSGLFLSPSNGELSLANAQPGTYTITYTSDDCGFTSQDTIKILPDGNSLFSYQGDDTVF